jgi:hypothetical protein
VARRAGAVAITGNLRPRRGDGGGIARVVTALPQRRRGNRYQRDGEQRGDDYDALLSQRRTYTRNQTLFTCVYRSSA